MEPLNQNYQDPHGEPRRWVVITQNILGAKDINAQDKLLLAYISSYEQYYASNASAAEFLGLTERVVERSRQKLTRLGYIDIVANTGRGNIYSFRLCRLAKNGGSDSPKMADQTSQNWRTENKEENKLKTYKGDESVAEQENEEKKTEYGREDINELIELWETETGITIKGQPNQRRQLYNLLRKYGPEATKTLVKRVGAAIRSGDRFAPQIATPSDLTGKYSKLPRLELWEQRKEHSRSFGQSREPIPAPAMAYQPRELPTYGGAFEIQTDDERAEVSKMFKDARANLPFMKKGGDNGK